MIASIPSPDVGTLSLGPLNLRLYGLMVALGVIGAAYLGARLLQRRGLNPEWAPQVCTVGVPLGLIGARAYHVLTDWKSYQGRWVDVVKIWEGGLGIPGGIVGALLGGLIVIRLRRMPLRSMLDMGAVGIPLGQAIGRLGNWFNQELFGRPTDLPWGLEIDPQHRPAAYRDAETFHPTFAYEMVWNLLLCGFLWRLHARGRFPRGHLFAVYLFGYAAGRLWIEALRVDHASLLAGVRVNIWVMGAVGVLSGLFLLLVTPRRRRVEAERAAALPEDSEDAADPGGVAAPDEAAPIDDSEAERATGEPPLEQAPEPASGGSEGHLDQVGATAESDSSARGAPSSGDPPV